jgi:hypothetical protein
MTWQLIYAYTFSTFLPFSPLQSSKVKCQALCSQSLSIISLFIPVSAINHALMAGAYQYAIWQPPVSALSPSTSGNEAMYCSQNANRPTFRQKILLIFKFMTSRHQRISPKN